MVAPREIYVNLKRKKMLPWLRAEWERDDLARERASLYAAMEVHEKQAADLEKHHGIQAIEYQEEQRRIAEELSGPTKTQQRINAERDNSNSFAFANHDFRRREGELSKVEKDLQRRRQSLRVRNAIHMCVCELYTGDCPCSVAIRKVRLSSSTTQRECMILSDSTCSDCDDESDKTVIHAPTVTASSQAPQVKRPRGD